MSDSVWRWGDYFHWPRDFGRTHISDTHTLSTKFPSIYLAGSTRQSRGIEFEQGIVGVGDGSTQAELG
jgi:thioredoxin reductase